MPNWCYTTVCFKGKPENIKALRQDIEATTEFTHEHGGLWTNIRYLLSLKGFDTVSYYERFPNRYTAPSFRGYVYDTPLKEADDGDYLLYYPTFEMAWDMDYEVLQIISMLYGVEFSAYSEESGMCIRHKCRNGDIEYCDFDYSIVPDYEQFESAIEENPEIESDIGWDNPVKQGSTEQTAILGLLKELGINYHIEHIPEVPVPTPYGVYYHYTYGVRYDDENFKKFYEYPGLDRFNIINNIK
jgi:hypothetical protein